MKRWLSLLLTAAMLLALAGCARTHTAPANTAQNEAPPVVTLPVIESGDGAGASPADDFFPAKTDVPPENAAPVQETAGTEPGTQQSAAPEEPPAPDEDGVYDGKDEVALYLHLYGHLPSNYITKKEAEALGWPGGDLTPYAPGKCIGGGRFGNYEGLLPSADGRRYNECDIGTLGKKSRGAKRLVYSNDGLIYYTGDHYESFELLYGEE